MLSIKTKGETVKERDSKLKTLIRKDTSQLFITVLFTVARTWKQCKCPSIEEWIKKIWYIYTMEYYSTRRKDCLEKCQ